MTLAYSPICAPGVSATVGGVEGDVAGADDQLAFALEVGAGGGHEVEHQCPDDRRFGAAPPQLRQQRQAKRDAARHALAHRAFEPGQEGVEIGRRRLAPGRRGWRAARRLRRWCRRSLWPIGSRHGGRHRPAALAQPQPHRDGEAADQRRAEDHQGAPIGSIARLGIGVEDEIVGIGGPHHGADPEHARLDAVPAVGVRMPERDIGIARELAGEFGLIVGKPGGIGDAGRVRQLGEQPLGDLVGVLQRVVPALQRGGAKAAHRLRLDPRQALQREQRVAVELDAVIGGIEGFERDPLFVSQPWRLPGRTDRGIDAAVDERAGDLVAVERDRFELAAIDPLGLECGGQLDIENIAGRQSSELGLDERGGRSEIGIGAVIDGRAARLEDRRQQQQRRALGDADDQLGGAGAELGAALGHLADRVDRRLAAVRARLDLDLEPGVAIKPLPQRRVIAGKLELRRAVQLEHELVRGACGAGNHHRRQNSGDGHQSRHRASRLAGTRRSICLPGAGAAASMSARNRGEINRHPGNPSARRLGRRQVEADVQFLEALGRHRRRRLHHQVARLLVHREKDDLADVRRVGQEPDDAVDPRREARHAAARRSGRH